MRHAEAHFNVSPEDRLEKDDSSIIERTSHQNNTWRAAVCLDILFTGKISPVSCGREVVLSASGRISRRESQGNHDNIERRLQAVGEMQVHLLTV